MAELIECDVCVVGAGAGGLTVAAGAAQMGARVVLVERGRMGGDCLNVGCVPSKALLAAGHAAAAARDASRLGVALPEPSIDASAVRAHVSQAIGAIAPNDSVERFRGLGVDVLQGHARFTDESELTVECSDGATRKVQARRIVLATGSEPAVPDLPGLADQPFLTNETIFDLHEIPDHLVVVGAGPVGVELAQAHRRLGSRVSLVSGGAFLGREDPELAGVVHSALAADGVEIHTGRVASVEPGPAVVLGDGTHIAGSHLLLATGRRPVTDGLDLARAGIRFTDQGIDTDPGLRTSNRRVFAIGDCTGRLQFTHVANWHAGIVLRRILFRLPAKAEERAIPRVIFTEPELAQVGPTEDEARLAHGGDVGCLRWPMHENDRAQAEGRTAGLVKVVVGPGGRILGAGIAGPHAGESIPVWTLAIRNRMQIGAVAGLVFPYPTFAESSKRAAGSWYATRLFSPFVRRVVRRMMRLPF